jgi:hypothetical protein
MKVLLSSFKGASRNSFLAKLLIAFRHALFCYVAMRNIVALPLGFFDINASITHRFLAHQT